MQPYIITDPNYFLLARPGFFGFRSLILVYGVMRIRWLVRTVEREAYLREYDGVGVRCCTYSCKAGDTLSSRHVRWYTHISHVSWIHAVSRVLSQEIVMECRS
jgi:hypothetical protein